MGKYDSQDSRRPNGLPRHFGRRRMTGALVLFAILLILAAGPAQAAETTYGDVAVDEIVYVQNAGIFHANIKAFPPLIGEKIIIVIDGMDPPELWTQDPLSKAFAISALSFTTKTLREAKKIELKNIKRDTQFRLKADVYADGVNLADELIKAGLAKPRIVDEKTPAKPQRWERMSIVQMSGTVARVLLRQVTSQAIELQVATEVDCATRKSRVAETRTLVHGNPVSSNSFSVKDRPFVAVAADEPVVLLACGKLAEEKQQWVKLGEASGIEVYYHPASVANSPDGVYRRGWLSYGNEGEMYYLEIDCKGGRKRTLDVFEKGGSPRCPELPPAEPAWSHVPPGSVVSALMKRLCE